MRAPSHDSINVLHVDDDPEFLDLASTFLEREDDRLAIDTAIRPGEALARLEDEHCDCIVSDFDMPADTGIEFLERVRESYSDLPFILFTGKGSEEVASEAISAGVSDYLQKGTGTERYELLANRILTHVEQARTRQELEEREAHLSQAQTVADLGSWQLDLESDQLYWSDEVYRIFEVPDGESLTYERFLEYVHPADQSYVESEWAAALDGAEYDIQHRIVTESGETRCVRERADVEFDEEGTPTTAFGVVQDITERKEQDLALRLFREAVEAAGHAIYWTDRAGEIQYVNPAFEETTGYSADEAVGQTPAILKSDVHDTEFYESLWETILGGETWRNEVVNTTRDGEQYTVDQTIAPVEGEHGEIEHFVAVNADVTDRTEGPGQ